MRISKKLSLPLRHAPAGIGLTLQPDGWTEVPRILEVLGLTRTELEEVVSRNDKQRFAFDETGARIRASQGHSVPAELDLPVSVPPATLYHGTVVRFLPAIHAEGLRPMQRHDVHRSATRETAVKVGARRGKPVILEVGAAGMSRAGHEFRLSANGAWLITRVPPDFLSTPEGTR